MTKLVAPVSIVGAGPVGLVLALRLASVGVSTVILEAHSALVKQGSKACLIQGDALEVLDKFGCAQVIAAEGVTWTTARTYVRNQEIRVDRYPQGPGFGPFINISQFRIEQVLAAAVHDEPRCEIRFGHRVSAISQDEDSVNVRVQTANGEEELTFAYLIACDGVRSGVRHLMDVEWTGYTHQNRFLITDIRANLPLARERHFHYDPVFNPGRQLVMHPQPDNVWRIDWQLPADADIEAERRDGRLDRRIRAVIGDVPYEIDWISTYRFQQRVVSRFRVGRVLFAGDAAHALPPYGSRGMNSGIQDADNLAWKIALVLSGHAGDQLLESYHTERYAAARENLRVTEATIRFMVPSTRMRRFSRAVLLRLSHSLRAACRHVNSGTMAQPYTYTDSPLVQKGHPLLGAFAPDGRVFLDGTPTRLRRLLGPESPDRRPERSRAEFIGMIFTSDDAQLTRLADAARSKDWHIPARLLGVLPPGTPPIRLSHGISIACAEDDRLARTYGGQPGPIWWLVRPDGHLAARGERGEQFPRALRAAVGTVSSFVS
jgi:3-(3-hydroxy-phenyl)propionate hydroxylase